ncbi:hypothetical protein ACFYTQ_07465 [Nocardia sp. NPDC004068]|uniref:hypothetical protein n=1 Tax=Nocardia sp. NPDC004068 TaxID=3364303 RepID=UPI00369D5A1B
MSIFSRRDPDTDSDPETAAAHHDSDTDTTGHESGTAAHHPEHAATPADQDSGRETESPTHQHEYGTHADADSAGHRDSDAYETDAVRTEPGTAALDQERDSTVAHHDSPTASDSTVGDAEVRDEETRTGPASQSHHDEELDTADERRAADPAEHDTHTEVGTAAGETAAAEHTTTAENPTAGTGPADRGTAELDGTQVPDGESAKPPQPTPSSDDHPLFADADLERLRIEWREVQALFVDDPHQAVTRADELVGTTIDQLTRVIADRKQALESRWRAGKSADTEDLRQALRGYRGFFHRILGTNY